MGFAISNSSKERGYIPTLSLSAMCVLLVQDPEPGKSVPSSDAFNKQGMNIKIRPGDLIGGIYANTLRNSPWSKRADFLEELRRLRKKKKKKKRDQYIVVDATTMEGRSYKEGMNELRTAKGKVKLAMSAAIGDWKPEIVVFFARPRKVIEGTDNEARERRREAAVLESGFPHFFRFPGEIEEEEEEEAEEAKDGDENVDPALKEQQQKKVRFADEEDDKEEEGEDLDAAASVIQRSYRRRRQRSMEGREKDAGDEDDLEEKEDILDDSLSSTSSDDGSEEPARGEDGYETSDTEILESSDEEKLSEDEDEAGSKDLKEDKADGGDGGGGDDDDDDDLEDILDCDWTVRILMKGQTVMSANAVDYRISDNSVRLRVDPLLGNRKVTDFLQLDDYDIFLQECNDKYSQELFDFISKDYGSHLIPPAAINRGVTFGSLGTIAEGKPPKGLEGDFYWRELSEDEAATLIVKGCRGYLQRKKYKQKRLVLNHLHLVGYMSWSLWSSHIHHPPFSVEPRRRRSNHGQGDSLCERSVEGPRRCVTRSRPRPKLTNGTTTKDERRCLTRTPLIGIATTMTSMKKISRRRTYDCLQCSIQFISIHFISLSLLLLLRAAVVLDCREGSVNVPLDPTERRCDRAPAAAPRACTSLPPRRRREERFGFSFLSLLRDLSLHLRLLPRPPSSSSSSSSFLLAHGAGHDRAQVGSLSRLSPVFSSSRCLATDDGWIRALHRVHGDLLHCPPLLQRLFVSSLSLSLSFSLLLSFVLLLPFAVAEHGAQSCLS